MELAASVEESDARLLEKMYGHDFISGEVFRQVYGIEYRKPFAAYKESGRLPDRVREYCVKFLAGKAPRT